MPAVASADVLVIGDTPHDVACARAAGATAVGVATGGFSADELRGCGATVVFETLGDTDEVISRLGLAEARQSAPGVVRRRGRHVGSEWGPVALPVFKTGRGLHMCGLAGFDSQALPPAFARPSA